MRFEVKKFGNDPFPYQNLDADEILDIMKDKLGVSSKEGETTT